MRCLIVMLLIAGLIGCAESPSVVSSAEFVEWTGEEENGLCRTKEIDDIRYTVSYIPREQMALLEAGTDATPEEWNKVLNAKGDMQYFKLIYQLTESNQDILKYNLYDETEYFSRTNYLAFGIDKDVYLKSGKEQLPCRLHQFTPHYGISPKAEVVFAFDKTDSTQNITLVLEDELFGSGILQFEFTAEDLNNIPTIQY